MTRAVLGGLVLVLLVLCGAGCGDCGQPSTIAAADAAALSRGDASARDGAAHTDAHANLHTDAHEEEEEEETHAPKGTAVKPRAEVHFSPDLDEPEFHVHDLPAISEDRKFIAYSFVDDDASPAAMHQVVFVDVAKGAIDHSLTLAARGELAGYVDQGRPFRKEPWTGRVEKANAELAKTSWTAVAFAPGVDWNDDVENEPFQPPASVDGLVVGFRDRKSPFAFHIRTDDGTVLFEDTVKSWYRGKRGHLGLFAIAVAKDERLMMFRTRVDDEPYVLRIVTWGRNTDGGLEAGTATPLDAGNRDASRPAQK